MVAAVGRIVSVSSTSGGVRIRVDADGLAIDDAVVGESIAVNGVCLTVIALHRDAFDADVSRETLSCTAGFEPDMRVNLERALRLADRLGGHLVSGHVDGVGKVVSMRRAGDHTMVRFSAPAEIARYAAHKGSIAVNGVSLTVNDVNEMEFSVNLIPHTLGATNLGALVAGARVNLEVDTVARYVERMRDFGAHK